MLTGGVESGRTPFVGRDRELAELAEVLDTPRSDSFQFVQVVGEPGIGKTRLLAEVGALARKKGSAMVLGRATEFETDRSFGVFADALDDHFAAMGPDWMDRLDADTVARCALVFPAFGEHRAANPEPLGVQRYVLYRAVRSAMESLVDQRGLIVVLDDLHWADVASLELIEYLVRRPGRGRLTLVVAYRPRQLRLACHTRLARAVDGGYGHRLELGPLSSEAVETLLGADLSRARRTALLRASQGNPFYLHALSRSADPESWPGYPGDRADEVPGHVRSALLSEVDRLPGVGRNVVQGAAVAGEPVEPELVAVASELAMSQVHEGIDQALAADVFRGGTGRPVVEFRHPVLRHVVYESTSLGRRISAHQRLAAVLAQRGAAPEDRARHLEFAARSGDTDAAAVLVEAARRVRFRAPATAAQWLASALRLVPDRPVDERVELQLELADALTVSGQTEAGGEVYREILQALSPAPSRLRTKAVTSCATVERIVGHNAAARALLVRELAAMRDQDPVETTALLQALGYVEHNLGNHALAEDFSRRVVDAPLPSAGRALHAGARALIAHSRMLSGDYTEAVRWLEEAIGDLDGLSDQELADHLFAVEQVYWVALGLGRYPEVLRHTERALAVAQVSGQNLAGLGCHVPRATALFLTGRLAEAEAAADDAIEIATLVGQHTVVVLALVLQSHVAGACGDRTAGVRIAQEAIALATAPEHPWRAHVLFQLAEARRLAGMPVDFHTEFRELAVDNPAQLRSRLAPFQLEQLTAAAVSRGDLADAADWVRRGQARAHELVPGSTAFALLAEAHLLLAKSDAATAATRAKAAAEQFTTAHLLLSAAQAHLLAATALAALDLRPAAVIEVDRATALFAECGAGGWAKRATILQRRLERAAPRTAPQVMPGELTARERQIADLISQGHRNRDIAQQLALSERTVTTHVTNILAKTGLASRTALAAHILRPRDGD